MSDHYRGIDEDGAYKSRRSTQSTSSRAGQSPAQRGTGGQRPSGSSQRSSTGGQRPNGSSQRSGTGGQRQSAAPRQSAGGSRPVSSQPHGAANAPRTEAPRQADGGQYIGGGRRTAGSRPQAASTRGGSGSYSGGGYSRSNNARSVNARSAAERPSASGQQPHAERRSAVGKYTGAGSEIAHTATSAKNNASSGFTVNISEDDYYDDGITMREISEAKSTAASVRRRSTASEENALVPVSGSPTMARRIVTDSMGDTYQIQDDGVMAPRQLRSRQKMIKKRNRGCVVALVYSAAVCSISILLAYYLIVGVNDMFALVKDRDSKDGTNIVVEVPKGATLDDVADLLDQKGVVEYPFFFKTYAKISKKNTGFKAGSFTLNTKNDYNQLLTKLRLPAGADKSTINVTIPEGLTVEQVAVIMEDNSICEAENFLKSAREVEFTQKFLSNINTKDRPYKVEGYLYPDTYNFYLSEGSVNAINRLLNAYQQHWTDEYAEKAKEIGMSMDEVIILASIVEREASRTDDRYGVASVFANRLKNSKGTGGKLQSDATRWYPYATKKELLASDKLTQAEKDDWINNNTGICDTYRLKGLPPCPICSPSLDSINAVLYHDNTGYYYFCSDAKGDFYFAKTLKEHNANLKKAGLA